MVSIQKKYQAGNIHMVNKKLLWLITDLMKSDLKVKAAMCVFKWLISFSELLSLNNRI